jgi:DNA polymerase III alpha subunit
MSRYRVGLPDIDSDFGNRDAVLEVLRKEFGNENVVPISNYNTTKLKSLTKDISKFYGIDFAEVNVATATVEQEVRKATMKEGMDKNLFVLTYDDSIGLLCENKETNDEKPICLGCTLKCKKPVSSSYRSFIEKYPQVGESIKVLFKQNRSLGRHAGGVLICDDLPEKMPLITSKGEPQSAWVEGTQFKHLEKIGSWVKLDLLGIETLRLVENTIGQILTKTGIFELNIEGQIHRLCGDQFIKLSDDSWKRVSDISQNDDICLPLHVKK